MRARILAVMILLFAVLSALTQAQVVLTDDANTFSFTPKSNYGDSIALIVCSWSNAYIKFSMANLGPGITSSNVSKASLVLYADFVLTSGTMDVYQVNGSWSEGSITYNNAPTLGAKLFSAVPVTKPGFLSLDMTSSVQAWLAGSLTNNGIALVPTTGSAISASFDSKENIFTSHPADLDLVLISAGPQGQQGLQGPQGTVGPQGPTGATGPAGAMGPTGATGPAGQQGLQGMMGLTGLTGATGPTGANGTGFNFRNGFDNSASYVANDVVTYNGSSYVATAASAGPSNPTPDTNTTAWTIMAAQGATGAAGAQGPAGSAGAAGGSGPAGAQGPAGATGPAGPIGLTGPPGSGGGGLSGIQEFTQSGTFTAPAAVTHVLVEMWGAGGGGGGGGDGYVAYSATCSGTSGFGGGSGAYTRAVVGVTAGVAYTVTLGIAGSGGPNVGSSESYPFPSGGNGTDSVIADSSGTVVVSAKAGAGGPSGAPPKLLAGLLGEPECENIAAYGSSPGAGGAAASGTGVVGRAGAAGGPSVIYGTAVPAAVGPAAGSISNPPGVGYGGKGGFPAYGNDNGGPGSQGGPGYVLITW